MATGKGFNNTKRRNKFGPPCFLAFAPFSTSSPLSALVLRCGNAIPPHPGAESLRHPRLHPHPRIPGERNPKGVARVSGPTLTLGEGPYLNGADRRGRQGLQVFGMQNVTSPCRQHLQHLDGQAVGLAQGVRGGHGVHKRLGAAGRGRAWAGAGAISRDRAGPGRVRTAASAAAVLTAS